MFRGRQTNLSDTKLKREPAWSSTDSGSESVANYIHNFNCSYEAQSKVMVSRHAARADMWRVSIIKQ